MKLSYKKTKIIFAVFFLTFVVSQTIVAQCGSAVKQGIKKLAPYTHNGQVNNVTLVLGEPSEVHLSFYKGLYYKLQICSEAAVGKVNFRVLDENNTELYNSANAANQADFWEFFSNSTQELVIQISSADKSKQGCAAIVVGMQIPKANNNSIRNL